MASSRQDRATLPNRAVHIGAEGGEAPRSPAPPSPHAEDRTTAHEVDPRHERAGDADAQPRARAREPLGPQHTVVLPHLEHGTREHFTHAQGNDSVRDARGRSGFDPIGRAPADGWPFAAPGVPASAGRRDAAGGIRLARPQPA